ncbi:MAG: hypothetical protein ACNS60_15025 [Candidatus Cyclobacteriaceae bacterium M2_1C_046]
MLYTRKNTEEYNALAEQVINHAKKSGYKDIKADFTGYETPSPLRMVSEDITLTPDFTAVRNGNKYYFELVVKNGEKTEHSKLISKWKALEMIAKMKGGSLELFVPHGSFKYATELVKDHSIDANLNKMTKA